MITILDEIQLPAGELAAVLQRLESDYFPAAADRGLSLLGQWVSPPVVRPDQTNTLWLQWQVADTMSYITGGGSIITLMLTFPIAWWIAKSVMSSVPCSIA